VQFGEDVVGGGAADTEDVIDTLGAQHFDDSLSGAHVGHAESSQVSNRFFLPAGVMHPAAGKAV
jgi:hypothetical protein